LLKKKKVVHFKFKSFKTLTNNYFRNKNIKDFKKKKLKLLA
jgi:hypothetical protein